jgi:gliding motility-associated-like protein
MSPIYPNRVLTFKLHFNTHTVFSIIKRVFILMAFPFVVMGQNFVQNPGFETHSALPTSVAQWNLATTWSNANSSSASPDYLHTSGTGMVQLPNSIFGTVSPHQGNAVMGMCMWHSTTSNFREYISQQLTAPLVTGTTYSLSFFITCGVPGGYGGVGIKNVQAHFSTAPINQSGYTPLGYTPLLSSTTMIYSNTWIPITFTFTAASPYTYFAIGNFLNDASTVTQTFNSTGSPSAYYFIDDVSLVVANNPVTITGLQTICSGNSTVLTGSGASTYTWLPGNITTNTISVSPTSTTTYTLLTGSGSATISTVATVTVDPAPSVTATTNGILNCATNTVALNSNLSSGTTYTWSGPGFSGSTNGQNAVATAAGSYTLKVTNAITGCTNIATTSVTQNTSVPSPTASATGSLTCSTTTVALNGAPSAGVTYTWSGPGFTGSVNGQNAVATAAGSYTLKVTDAVSSCSNMATTTVNQNTTVPSPTASTTGTLTCSATTVLLNGGPSAGVTYTWTGPSLNGSINGQSAVAGAAGSYTLKVTDAVNGCTNIATTSVSQNTATPSPTASVTGTLTCGTPTVLLNGSPSSGVTYTWTGPGFTGSTNGQNAVATTGGSYTLTVTDAVNGCTNTATATVAPNSTTLSPTASTTGTLTCSTTTLALNGTPSSAVTYTWTGPGIISGANTSSPVINLPGTYSMGVTDASGCSATATTSVLQNILAPTVTISSTVACGTSTVQLSATTSTNTVAYNWTAPATGALTSNSIFNPVASGTGVFTVVVTNTINGCSASGTTTLAASPVTLTLSVNNATICSGSSATLTATGNAASYSWSPAGSFSSSTGSSVTASPNATSVYTLTGTTGACSVAVEFTVVVIATPVISISSSTTTICTGSSATLQASGASSYTWAPASSLSSSTGNTVIANPAVTITYSVTGTNTAGLISCTSSQSVVITVMPKVNGLISPNEEICEGSYTTISASGGTVKWLPPTGLANPNDPVTKASPSVSTTYTALISASGLCPDSKTIDVTVNPKPAVNAGMDTTVIFGDSLVLAGTGDGTLMWTSGEFLTCNHCRNPLIIPADNSCYVLEAITDKGCANFDERCIKVDKQSAVYIPNTFTPNGDGVNDVFTVSGFGITDIELSIFDRWGALIFKTNDLIKGWDGKNKGVLCENGVYIYKAIIKTISMETEEKVGHVTLLK